MKKKKKIIIISAIIIALLVIGLVIFLVLKGNNDKSKKKSDSDLPALPKPQVTGGERGKLGIDKNVNESTIDKYLNRSDSVYRDMRMLVDPGNYEAIGGDSYLSGYVKGFEVVPLPYIINVTGLPDDVGDTYQGDTLFITEEDGSYKPKYEESMKIIEELFPKDKNIFLMCGGGGYAGMMKEFLVSLGWNKNKIYVVGGYWYYEGENKVEVKKKVKGKVTYDFDSVPYHEIKFDDLKKIKYVPKHGKNAITLSKRYYNTTVNEDLENKLNVYSEKIDKIYSQINEIEKAGKKNSDDLVDSLNEEIDKIYEEVDNYKAEYINNLLEEKESFVIITYIPAECEDDGDSVRYNAYELADNYEIYMYDIEFDIFKKTNLYGEIKYSPSVIIINKGKVLAYTDPESDEDIKLGEDYKAFEKWFAKYVVIK